MRFKSANQRKAVMAKLRETKTPDGYLDKVINPVGTKGNVTISQTYGGWTARKGDKNIGKVPNKVENYARRLAKSGYKVVRILD